MWPILIGAFALLVGYSDGDFSNIPGKIDAWKAAHPYQTDKAPANPAQIVGGGTSTEPDVK